MAATIKIKNSSTAGAAPTASDLVQGELAVNVTDKRLYTENSGGTIVELGTNPSVPVTFPDGSASAPSLTNSGDTNTGMFFPAADTIAFAEGGTETMRLDSSGNLGLGVTPSAWASSYKVLDVGNTGSFYFDSSGAVVSNNSFINSSFQYRYKTSNAATRYEQTSAGQHQWFNAASGTAGNTISFTQAMTLDASGNLLVNTTTAREKITVNGSIAASGQFIPYSGSTSLGYIGNDSSISGGSGSNIGLRSEAAMLFATGGSTERARIDSSGNLLVGTTSQTNAGKVEIRFAPGSNQGIALRQTADSPSVTPLDFINAAGTRVGSVQTTSTATTYNTSSDYRLKENIVPMVGALAKVSALKPVTYTWKSTGEASEGFIAHELAEVCPHAVVGEKDAADAEGNPVYQGIDTSFLVATLTAAIQELKAEFDAYKATHP